MSYVPWNYYSINFKRNPCLKKYRPLYTYIILLFPVQNKFTRSFAQQLQAQQQAQQPMDPLYVLRDHVVNNKPVHPEGNDIVFQNNVRFPKSTQTIFKNRLTKEHFTLEALFFAYQHADSAPSAYMAACYKSGLKFVSLVDNQDLQAFLRGQIDSSPSIDVSAIAPAPTPAPTPILYY
jgi:hypothetical protein